MAETLQELLLAPDVRPNVIADGVTLVEEEVSEKGLIIKGAYKTVTAFASDFRNTPGE